MQRSEWPCPADKQGFPCEINGTQYHLCRVCKGVKEGRFDPLTFERIVHELPGRLSIGETTLDLNLTTAIPCSPPLTSTQLRDVTDETGSMSTPRGASGSPPTHREGATGSLSTPGGCDWFPA